MSTTMRADKARVRERILQAAAQVFQDQGYEVSMEALAAAADVSKQTLYNQFGSKEDLFKAIVGARGETLRAPLAHAGPERAPRDVLMDLVRQYYALAITPASAGFMRMLIAGSARFPEIGVDFYEVGPSATLKALSEWIAREDRLGRLDAADPKLAAEHFLSLILGHMQLKGLLGLDAQPSEAELERRARFCVDTFMRAFSPRP